MAVPLSPKDSDVPVTGLCPVNWIKGDDDEDTKLLQDMAQAADAYIRSFTWCRSVSRSFFAGGVGGIFAIFLFDIIPDRRDVDRWIWIVVGDTPPAYLPFQDAKSPGQVFSTYIQGMVKWVQSARQGICGTPEDGVPPVSVPATPEWAENIEKKLHLLQLIVKPFFDDPSELEQVH